jgi:NADPH:quinone reductase-like Zn-dependent oxidoreductase
MLELAEQVDCPAIIQNAAGGQVPNIMQKMAERKGIRVINLVRKAAHIDALKSRGMTDVLDISDVHFEENLKQLAGDLRPAMAFDAVAGELAGKMLNAMPAGAKLVIYGALSGDLLAGIDPMDIIFHRKSITGFNLNEWMAGMSREKFTEITDAIQNMVIAGEIATTVQGTYQLNQLVQGLRAYIKSMSAGKIIFTP